MARFHHVNVGVPSGGIGAQGSFLVDVLGYRKVRRTDAGTGTGAVWFESADGAQVHLSEDPDHRPAARAHVALDCSDDLDAVLDRLRAAHWPFESFDLERLRIVNCLDPSGNRWELRGNGPTSG